MGDGLKFGPDNHPPEKPRDTYPATGNVATARAKRKRDRFFNRRGFMALQDDRSQHRRFAWLYDDLMS